MKSTEMNQACCLLAYRGRADKTLQSPSYSDNSWRRIIIGSPYTEQAKFPVLKLICKHFSKIKEMFKLCLLIS